MADSAAVRLALVSALFIAHLSPALARKHN